MKLKRVFLWIINSPNLYLWFQHFLIVYITISVLPSTCVTHKRLIALYFGSHWQSVVRQCAKIAVAANQRQLYWMLNRMLSVVFLSWNRATHSGSGKIVDWVNLRTFLSNLCMYVYHECGLSYVMYSTYLNQVRVFDSLVCVWPIQPSIKTHLLDTWPPPLLLL